MTSLFKMKLSTNYITKFVCLIHPSILCMPLLNNTKGVRHANTWE